MVQTFKLCSCQKYVAELETRTPDMIKYVPEKSVTSTKQRLNQDNSPNQRVHWSVQQRMFETSLRVCSCFCGFSVQQCRSLNIKTSISV